MRDEQIKEGLTSLFASIASKARQSEQEAFEQQKALLSLFDIQRPLTFSLLLRRLHEPLRGLLNATYQDKTVQYKIHFLFFHLRFIESQFERIITKLEGSPFCADKSGYLVKGILRFLATGEEIRHTESTYYIPKCVFQSHKEIIDYFDALYYLIGGNPSKFVSLQSQYEAVMAFKDHAPSMLEALKKIGGTNE